jgi:hypothetical protein
MIGDDKVTENYVEVYENFIAEGEQNIHDYDELLGKPIKYGDKFQLYQVTTRRYMCLHPYSNIVMDKYIQEKSIEGKICIFAYSENPCAQTHFEFEACADYQKEEDHMNVKSYHDCYLISKAEVKLYFCNIKECCLFTQNLKTVVKPFSLPNKFGSAENRAYQRTSYVLISHGVSNKYLY